MHLSEPVCSAGLALVRYHSETEQVLSQILIVFDKILFWHCEIGLAAPVPGFISVSRAVVHTSHCLHAQSIP